MTQLSRSRCSQLEQIYVPVPDPSWGRVLQALQGEGSCAAGKRKDGAMSPQLQLCLQLCHPQPCSIYGALTWG